MLGSGRCSAGASGSGRQGPIRGGSSASTAGQRRTMAASSRPSARPFASAHNAIPAPVAAPPVVAERRSGRRHEQPAQHLLGVQRREQRLGRVEEVEELLVAEVADAGHGEEARVGLAHRLLGEQRQRRAETADAPRGVEPPRARTRIELAEEAVPGRRRADRVEVDRHPAADRRDELRAREARRRHRAGQAQRPHHAVAQRIQPEVALEHGERVGKRLRERAGPPRRSGRRARRRRDRPTLEEHETAAVVDRPLDVLRGAEQPRRAVRQLHQRAQLTAAEVAERAFRRQDAAVLRQQVLRAVDLAAHQLVGPARHRRDHTVVVTARHRIDAEEHTAELGIEHRLDQHRERRFLRRRGAGRHHHLRRPPHATRPNPARRGSR